MVHFPGVAASALLASLLCASGCTEFEDGSDTLPDEGGGALEPGGPDWDCVGMTTTGPRPPPMSSTAAPDAAYSVVLTDFVSRRPMPGVRARACARVDVDCASPVVTSVTSGADGLLRVPLFQGFDGFLEIEADGMVPAMFFLDGPLQADTQGFPAFLVPFPAAAALADTVGVPLDPKFGLLGFWALDCQGLPAAGVVMSNDAGGLIYNFVAGLPAFQNTTADGIGGFVNVPAGRVLLRGVLSNGGNTIAVQSLLVRGGWLSVSNLGPRL